MIRPEIQGLRAVAVLLVVVFHTWPALLPGGFVGVDVFFVVSGYLITGLLLRELDRSGTVDLPAFYARRVRRLLPAATLVLLAVACAIPWLPSSRREDTATDVVASAIYLQNWNLAARAVDYNASESAASPIQHYWSLSVEEQFYVLWPSLLWLLARLRVGRDGAVAALGMCVGMSFSAAVFLGGADPSGYFVSHTRVWELGLGAMLAAVPWLAETRSWLGVPSLLAIVASAALLTGRTPFPGWAALPATLGAMGALVAGPAGWSGRLLSIAPLQWIGDRSYSIYLVHWPLLVAWRLQGHPTGAQATAVVGFATLAASAVVYRLVEEVFRHPGPRVPAAPWLATASLVPVAVAARFAIPKGDPVEFDTDDPNHPGAAVLFAGAIAPTGVEPVPDQRRRRTGDVCKLVGDNDAQPKPCRVGAASGKRFALVGDSHAQQWAPALAKIAERRGFQLEIHVKAACTPLLVPMSDAGLPERKRRVETCLEWGREVRRQLAADPPDLLAFAHAKIVRPAGVSKDKADAAMIEALRAMWADYGAIGAPILLVPDNPVWNTDPVECWERDPECVFEVARDRKRDLVTLANEGVGLRSLDLQDLVCPDGECRPVIGNVFVFRDKSHLSAEYVLTATPEVERRLLPLLPPGW